MTTQISEATTVLEATAVEGKPGRLLIGIISPGHGSSGYYSQECIEAAATDKVFPAGTHMFFDHPTESDKFERPERSVLMLGAVLEEDARWDATLNKLVSEASPIAAYRELLEDKTFQSAIGVSIRASAEVSEGEIDGKRTTIIDRLVESQSVDFVTRAGRGGSILNVLESARPSTVNNRALKHDGVEEATVNDQRGALSELLTETYGGEKTWVWLRDFDATTCWFDIDGPDIAGTWQQTYTTGDDDLVDALTDDRVEVRMVTQFVPVNPAGRTTTEESEEDTMATTPVEESEYARLKEAAGRVTALETERDTEKAGRETAETALAESKRLTRIDAIIAEADTEFNDLEVAGLKSQAPVKEGVLDEEAFTKTVAEAAAKLAEDGGAGKPRANGRTQPPGQGISEAEYATRLGLTKNGA